MFEERLRNAKLALKAKNFKCSKCLSQFTKKVKLITCFHDSWIYDFFSRNFLCFTSTRYLEVFNWNQKLTVYHNKKKTLCSPLQKMKKIVDSWKTCDELVKRHPWKGISVSNVLFATSISKLVWAFIHMTGLNMMDILQRNQKLSGQ